MATKRHIRVVVCPPFENPQLVDIEDRLAVFQRIVGGGIEKVSAKYNIKPWTDRSLAIICNDNGIREGLSRHHFNIHGTFFWVRTVASGPASGNWHSVNYQDILEIARLLAADKVQRGL